MHEQDHAQYAFHDVGIKGDNRHISGVRPAATKTLTLAFSRKLFSFQRELFETVYGDNLH